jgi:hypothetical protein
MPELRWKCPVHGYVQVAALGGNLYCYEEDDSRPAGVCNRPCEGPAMREDGTFLEGLPGVGSQTTNLPRDPQIHRAGEEFCEQCEKDLEGEHSLTLRCRECRDRVPTYTWSYWKRQHGLEEARRRAKEVA